MTAASRQEARPWLSADQLNTERREVWGPEAVNVVKMGLEGEFAPEQLVWGLYMNGDSREGRLLEPKCVKG